MASLGRLSILERGREVPKTMWQRVLDLLHDVRQTVKECSWSWEPIVCSECGWYGRAGNAIGKPSWGLKYLRCPRCGGDWTLRTKEEGN